MIRRWRSVPDPPPDADDLALHRGVASPPTIQGELSLLALVGALQLIGMTMAAHAQPDRGSLYAGGYALLAASVAVLPLRHRFPLGVLAATFLATQLYWAQDLPRGPAFVGLLVAAIHVMLIGHRRVAIATLVVGFALFPTLGYALGNAERPDVVAVIGAAAWLLALVAIVEIVRIRRDRAYEAARSEAEAMRRQVADERVRMARELHDSVAHNMSLISIQAGVALHLLEQSDDGAAGPPQPVTQSLAVIRDASKEALVELRSVLGALRDVDTTAPRTPLPSLDRLDDLVERARSVGVAVHVELRPEAVLTELPRPVDLAAFRIIQESLTNVSRHSGADSASVRLTKREGILLVEVVDEGRGVGQAHAPDVPGGGNGIVGMRERAAAVGGRLEAGPRPGGGFAVRAELPLESQPRVSAVAQPDRTRNRRGGVT